MKRLVVIAMLSLLLPCLIQAKEKKEKAGAAAGGNSEQEVTTLTKELNEAALKADVATYERLTSDDYTSINIYGTVSTKADLLENIKTGKTKFDSIDLQDVKARVYGDAALVTTTADVKGHSGDTDISGQYRSVRVWIKRKGQWQTVSFQATRVTKP